MVGPVQPRNPTDSAFAGSLGLRLSRTVRSNVKLNERHSGRNRYPTQFPSRGLAPFAVPAVCFELKDLKQEGGLARLTHEPQIPIQKPFAYFLRFLKPK